MQEIGYNDDPCVQTGSGQKKEYQGGAREGKGGKINGLEVLR